MINERHVREFCCEDITQIENYDKAIADKEHTWHCHHRGEILPCGVYSREVLKKFGLYFNRPASELIFLTYSEHRRLHNNGRKFSEETRRKISEAQKGNKYALGCHHSEETRRKMSEAKKRYWANRRAGK